MTTREFFSTPTYLQTWDGKSRAAIAVATLVVSVFLFYVAHYTDGIAVHFGLTKAEYLRLYNAPYIAVLVFGFLFAVLPRGVRGFVLLGFLLWIPQMPSPSWQHNGGTRVSTAACPYPQYASVGDVTIRHFGVGNGGSQVLYLKHAIKLDVIQAAQVVGSKVASLVHTTGMGSTVSDAAHAIFAAQSSQTR